MNHVTLAVSDLQKSVSCYINAPGLQRIKEWNGNAHLTAGEDQTTCLSQNSSARTPPHPDYTHMAFDVSPEKFDDIKQQCLSHGATGRKKNTSEGNSCYFLDLDGHKLEVHVGTLKTRLKAMQ